MLRFAANWAKSFAACPLATAIMPLPPTLTPLPALSLAAGSSRRGTTAPGPAAQRNGGGARGRGRHRLHPGHVPRQPRVVPAHRGADPRGEARCEGRPTLAWLTVAVRPNLRHDPALEGPDMHVLPSTQPNPNSNPLFQTLCCWSCARTAPACWLILTPRSPRPGGPPASPSPAPPASRRWPAGRRAPPAGRPPRSCWGGCAAAGVAPCRRQTLKTMQWRC